MKTDKTNSTDSEKPRSSTGTRCSRQGTTRREFVGGLALASAYNIFNTSRSQSKTDGGEWPTSRGDVHNTGWTAGLSDIANAAEEVWSFEPKHQPTSVSVTADQAFVTTYNGTSDPYVGNVYAFDTETGVQRWQFGIDLWIQNVTVVGTTVYIQANGRGVGRVYALDAGDGSQKWVQQEGSEIVPAPTVVNETAYIGTIDDEVIALDATEGTVDWRTSVSGAIFPSPAVGDGRVYVTCDHNATGDTSASGTSTVQALDTNTGTEEWSYEIGPTRIYTAPVFANGTVIATAADGKIRALSAMDGSFQWQFNTGANQITDPVVHDGTVYVGAGSSLTALNIRDGTSRWESNFESRIQQLVGTAGALYVSVENGPLVVVSNLPGTDAKVSRLDEVTPSSTAVANERIYTITDQQFAAYSISQTDQKYERQSAEQRSKRTKTADETDSEVSVFERLGQEGAFPLIVLGGGLASGIGIGAYLRYSNGDDE